MFASLARGVVSVLDVLLPQRCVSCNFFGDDICDACCSRFLAIAPVVHTDHPSLRNVTALGSYTGALRGAILALKFRQRRGVAVRLGTLLGRSLRGRADYLVAVPLHAERLRQRGFNQALEIANGISSVCDIPIAEGVIARHRATAPQSGLAQRDRSANVEHAFGAGPNTRRVRGQTFVLVDDVMTTGATLSACASVLCKSGATHVNAAVLALKL